MHENSVFDELELVIKMAISSKSHKEKNQTRTKKMMQGCNGWSSLQTIWSSNSSRAPLDSTTIDPITRSPNYHHESGKYKTGQTFSLHEVYLSYMMTILTPSSWTTFLDCVRSMKTSWLLPHTLWVSHSLAHIHKSIDTIMDGKLQAWFLCDDPLELAQHNLDLMSSSMGCMWSSSWRNPMEANLTPRRTLTKTMG